MDILFILLSITNFILTLNKRNIITPIFFSNLFFTISFIVFALSYYNVWVPLPLTGIPLSSFYVNTNQFDQTVILYIPFQIINLGCLIYDKYFLSGKEPKQKKFSLSINQINFGKKISKKSFLLNLFVCYILIFIIAGHALEINWSLVWSNNEYLLLARPERIDLNNILFATFHRALGFVGALSGFLAIFLYSKKRNWLGSFYLFVFFYSFIMTLADFSRWAVLMIGVVTICYFFCFGAKKLINKIILIVLVLLAFFLFEVCISGRGQPIQGIYGVLLAFNLFNDTQGSGIDLGTFFINIFGGFFVTSATVMNDVSYPLSYKLLSFSFLIGALDGWKDQLIYTQFVNRYIPYNVVAELNQFGLFYTVFFYIYFAFIQIFFLKALRNKGGLIYLLALSSFILMLSFMQFYPIRNSIRICTLVAIGIYVVNRFLGKKNREEVI